MPNIAAGLVVSPTTTARLVVSPHGTLGKWALEHHRWRKKLVWWCGQQFALTRAACFHATAESEAEDIRRFGFRQPIAIIPNGIDIPDKRRNETDERGFRRILFMGRLHPIKGLDRLIYAWSDIAHAHGGWELIIAGPEDYAGYQGELEGLVKRLGAPRVSFPGGIYGAQKSELLRRCDLFVLPSHTENFSMVVAEALAHGIPVIASKGTPWIDIDDHGCGWWVENSVEELRACLDKAMHLQQAVLKSMGARGHDWMERDFSWNTISIQFNHVYLWLSKNASRPGCVNLD
jgi:glycosyltransferase involved in cell wall biosynthesis